MIKLKNNFIFAPIKLGYSDGKGNITNKHISFYLKRSKYIGAITLEPLYMDKGLREIPTQIGIDNDEHIKGLNNLISLIHKDDTKVIAHLNHPGRMANPKIPNNYFISSTDKACENGGAIPKKMTIEDMNNVIDLFVSSAKRAEKSGFDAIELQFGHGYLLAQFISNFVNDRTDEYGGSFENRIKFPLKVLKEVQGAVKIPIIVRISADEMFKGGISLEEMIEFSKILEKNNVDAIHVSSGSVCTTPPWFFQHMFVKKGKNWDMAKKIKENVNIPIIFVGAVNTFEDIKKLENEYKADFIAIGRALISDSDFIGKYLGKEKGIIKPCLACSQGCLGKIRAGEGLKCLVNPEVGYEDDFKVSNEKKKYAVIGGGLAGIEAAITLKKIGHNVDLYEKNELGGQFNLAPLTINKKSMLKLVPYFIEELKNNNINIIFKEIKDIKELSNYDGIIIATGSVPVVPKIEGLKDFFWADILLEKNLPKNKNVLIIGGGLIGVDIATGLIDKKNKVTIVKRTENFGEDMEMISKTLSLKAMKENNVVFSDHTNIKKIEGKTIYAQRDDKDIKFENIDIIVVSSGMKNYNPFNIENNKNVYIIGDAKKVGNAQDAIRDAYVLAKSL